MDAGRRRAHPDDEAEAQADRRQVRGRDRGALFLLSEEAQAASAELALARAVWARFNAGQLDSFWELLHPNVVVVTDPNWPGGGEFHGRERLREFIGGFIEAFDDVRFEEDRAPEIVGDWLVLHGRWIARGARSGAEVVSFQWSQVTRIENDVIVESRFFFDEDAAREFAQSQT